MTQPAAARIAPPSPMAIAAARRGLRRSMRRAVDLATRDGLGARQRSGARGRTGDRFGRTTAPWPV